MKRIFFLALLFLFNGCYLKSVHPLISETNATLMPGLEGRWESDSQRWTIINDGSKFGDLEHLFETEVESDDIDGTVTLDSDNVFSENSYILIYENLDEPEADTTYFLANTGMIAGQMFMDLVPFDIEMENVFVSAHFVPVHTFSRVEIVNGELVVSFFKDSWIKELISNNQVRIKHEKLQDDDILITAQTQELLKFVEKYADTEDAFDKPMTLTNVFSVE